MTVTANAAPSEDNIIRLTVCGARVVNGRVSGETFEFDLGDEGTDERAANDRQVRAWVMGGHVVDPVLASRRKKRARKVAN